TGGVNQTGLERHAEAGVDALPVLNGTHRGASAQMAGDRAVRLSAAPLVEDIRNIAMGCAVIPQPLYAIFFIPLIGDAVKPPLQGNLLVEARLKGPYKNSVRQNLPHDLNYLDVAGIVQHSQRQPGPHSIHDLLRQLVNAVVSL